MIELNKEQREAAQSLANDYGTLAVYHDGERFCIRMASEVAAYPLVLIEEFKKGPTK